MAGNESLSGLYMRLGLDFSELDQNFVQAERTLRANMASLSRENTIVRLRAEADLSGVEDADERIRIQTEALNRQIQIQEQRLRIATASLQSNAAATGRNSDNAQRASIAVERERLALRRLQNELNNVNHTQSETADGQNNLSESLAAIGTKAAGAVAALATVKQGLDFVVGSAEKVRESFSEIQKYSLILNMPMQETKDLLQLVRMTGSEIDDLEGAVRGVQSALATGDNEDREYVALKNLGLDPFNSDGTMKGFSELLDLMYEGYLKAKDLGREIEYVLDLGGDAGAKDLLQFFEQKPEAEKMLANVSKAEMPFEEMHKFDMEMKLLTEQTDEFQKAWGVAFTPLARETVQSLFEVFKTGTDFVKDSTVEIQKFGFALDIAGQKLKDFYSEKTGGRNLFDDVLSGAENLASLTPFGRLTDSLKNTLDSLKNTDVGGDIWNQATEKQKEYSQAVEESNKKFEELNEKAGKTNINLEAEKRLKGYQEELDGLRNELTNWGDDYSKNLSDLDAWYEQVLKQTQISEKERATITELYAAKREKIEREYAEKIAEENEQSQQRIKELMKETADIEFSATHSAFEKQLRDVEQWKQAQMEKAKTSEEVAAIIANAAAKESQAFQDEVDRIKGATQSLEDEIFAMEHSQYENDIRQAKQKAQRELENGTDSDTVKHWLSDKLGEIEKRASTDKTYSQNKNNTFNGRGAKYIELGEPKQKEIPLFTDENKIMERLKNGARQPARLEDILPKNESSGVEILKGVKSSFDNFSNAFSTVSQIEKPMTQDLTTENLKMLIDNLTQSNFTKDNFGAYGGADVFNFVNTLKNAGVEWTKISGYLDEVLLRQSEGKQGSGMVTVAPNINISLEGNVIADQQFESDLAERIKDEVYKGVTDAVESATQNNYSFAS